MQKVTKEHTKYLRFYVCVILDIAYNTLYLYHLLRRLLIRY